jgi:hypothetical protein
VRCHERLDGVTGLPPDHGFDLDVQAGQALVAAEILAVIAQQAPRCPVIAQGSSSA